VESFNGRLRDECLNEHLFPSLAAARRIIEAWRTDYNTVRPHSSLGGLAPAEFTNRPRLGHIDNEAKLSAASKRGAGQAQWLLGDRGFDAGWFRDAMQAKSIQSCIAGRRSCNEPVRYDQRRYRRRSHIEIMFGRLKDRRRVATRYDCCPTVFVSTVALAAYVIFWPQPMCPDPKDLAACRSEYRSAVV
jgi:transposase